MEWFGLEGTFKDHLAMGRDIFH